MRKDKNNGKFMLDEDKKNKRLGEMKYNNRGSLMKIIEYNDCRNVIVEFQDEHKTRIKCRYSQFKDGILTSPYDKSVYGIGYLGEGKYNSKDYRTIYAVWNDMLRRCYDPYWINKHLTYIDCFVEDYFHCFQNFGEWYEEKIYECNGERMNLDKDILEKGNKIYDREHMIFVPERINTLFVKNDINRGKYPIGVHEKYCRNILKLYTHCSTFNKENGRKDVFLGYFPLNEPFHAFYTYKIFKENYIKQVADEYKNLIPTKLYEAMYKYEVEIND